MLRLLSLFSRAVGSRPMRRHATTTRRVRLFIECLEDRCLLDSGGMVNVGELIFHDPSQRSLYSAVFDPTTGYALFATAASIDPLRVIKVDLNGPLPVEVGVAQANPGERTAVFGLLDNSDPNPANHYAYFGTPAGLLLKERIGAGSSPPTYLGSLAIGSIPGLSGSLLGGVIDTTNSDPTKHYAYVAVNTGNAARIVKVALGVGDALPAVVSWISLNANETGLRRAVIDTSDPVNHYAYFASAAGAPSPVVVKVKLGDGTDFRRIGAAALNADETPIGSAVIDPAHGYAYFGTYAVGMNIPPAKVIKISLGIGDAPPTRVGALTLNTGERELSTAVIDPVNDVAYFGSDHTYPAKVYKIQLGAGNALPTEAGVLQLAPGSLGTAGYPPDGSNITSADAGQYGEIYLQSSVIDLAHGFVYFGTDTVPGQIVKIQVAAAPPAGQVQFSGSAYSINEAGGSAVVTVTRTGGSSGTVRVNYATSNGTASAGVRYIATAGTLIWPDGDASSKSFTVPIINDTIYEGNQTVNLTLGNAAGGVGLGSPIQATLTIFEDDPPPPSSRMTFQSNRDGNNEIYVMNADGSGQTRLTNNPANDITPAFTRDGRKIAFVSNRDGNNEIYLMNPDGTGLTRLTNNPASDSSPSFSGDGSKIVFVSNRDGNNEIYVMNADGSGLMRLTSNPANDLFPSFTGDGGKIVFASDRANPASGNFQIYIMNADGSGQTRLTNDTASDFYPAFSPDGRRIVFESNRDGNTEIYGMNADGSGQTNLTHNPASDLLPSFSPDGSKIVFVSNRDGNNEIYVMNADGSSPNRLTSNPANDAYPSWDDVPPRFTAPGAGGTATAGGGSLSSQRQARGISRNDSPVFRVDVNDVVDRSLTVSKSRGAVPVFGTDAAALPPLPVDPSSTANTQTYSTAGSIPFASLGSDRPDRGAGLLGDVLIGQVLSDFDGSSGLAGFWMLDSGSESEAELI